MKQQKRSQPESGSWRRKNISKFSRFKADIMLKLSFTDVVLAVAGYLCTSNAYIETEEIANKCKKYIRSWDTPPCQGRDDLFGHKGSSFTNPKA